MKEYGNKYWPFASVLFLLVASCSPGNMPVNHETVDRDYENLYVENYEAEINLTDAIAMALSNNLDMKIAEQDYIVSLSDSDLQKLNALPSITAKQEFITRNNPGASSSISAETGVVSLEPSISTEQSRWVSTLEANWNILDSAINIYRSKSADDRAMIAGERVRKVQQNIIMDVYSAYWRLASYQYVKPSVEEALALSDEKLDALKQAKKNGDISYDQITSIQNSLYSKREQLFELKQSIDLADLEFKALLSLAPESSVKLKLDKDLFTGKVLPRTKKDASQYTKVALKKRPEIREELLNLRIAERNLNATIYETFPGLNLLATANDDENKFLEDNQWISLTAGITQSITRLLTLPARYTKAKEEIELANSRRRALVAAVISQVYIAQALYKQSRLRLNEAKSLYGVAVDKRKRDDALVDNGLLGGFEAVDGRLDFEIKRKNYYDRILDLHLTYARFMNAVGYDFIDFLNITMPDQLTSEGIMNE